MNKKTNNKTVSVRFNDEQIDVLKQQAIAESVKRKKIVNYVGLIREAVIAAYIKGDI